jgi:hypothetical protein
MSVVAVRKVRVESSSLARRVLASLELRRDYLAVCRAAYSLAKARSAVDRAAFSSDSDFFSSVTEAANSETSQSQEKNHRLEAVKERGYPPDRLLDPSGPLRNQRPVGQSPWPRRWTGSLNRFPP